MGAITKPNTFTAGQTADGSAVNSNFDTIYNDYNGNITNANIAAGAAIAGSKLDLSSPGTIGGTTPGILVASSLTATNASIGILVASSLTATNASIGTDIYTTAWTAYGATSTVVGWSSFTSKSIYYKKVGKLVFVQFDIGGVSDSGAVSFTLPFENNSNLGMWAKLGFAYDNTSYTAVTGSQNAVIYMAASSTAVTCGRYLASTLGNWTASNDKQVIGEFFYEASA